MRQPGTSVTISDSAASRAVESDPGTAFMVGLAERGPADRAVAVRSYSQFEAIFGGKVGYSELPDSVEAYFREGGSRAVIGREVGPAPVIATEDLTATDTPTLTVNSLSPGEWGNDIDVEVVAGGAQNTISIEVSYTDVLVEKSGDLASNEEAVAWAADSRYIEVVDLDQGLPDPQSIALTGGTDDRANITSVEEQVALDLFEPALGPGQVLHPGAAESSTWTALLGHAKSHRRIALLDCDETSVVADLVSDANSLRSGGLGRYGAMFAPAAIARGSSAGSTRTIPYSAVQAGLIARSDARTANPNIPAAGDNGECRWVIGLASSDWSDSDLATLNDAGVNAVIERAGTIRTYGYRTLTNPLTDRNWLSLASARLAMVVASEADRIAGKYVFAQLDGKRQTISDFGAELQGMVFGWYELGALYGETADEAFTVDVGPGVNDEQSISQGVLKAALALRMSPFAERVEITITKVPTEEAL